MKIKGLIDESFVDYKKPVMYIAFPYCTFKCDRESGKKICQNSQLVKEPNIEISTDEIIQRYLKNPITKGIVMAGLEPFDSFLDVFNIVFCLRSKYGNKDPIVIYTGYTETELDAGEYGAGYTEVDCIKKAKQWEALKKLGIIVKFGRFIPNYKKRFDKVLGIELASPNQYAKEFYNEYTS